MKRFKVMQVHEEQFQVWDMSIPDLLACYDNRGMAEAHAERALESYNRHRPLTKAEDAALPY